MSEKLWRMYIDCGRMGDLSSVFIATEEDVNELGNIMFGEVLGKHSEIIVNFKNNDCVELITDNQEVIKIIKDYSLENGLNPVEYWKRQVENKEYYSDDDN